MSTKLRTSERKIMEERVKKYVEAANDKGRNEVADSVPAEELIEFLKLVLKDATYKTTASELARQQLKNKIIELEAREEDRSLLSSVSNTLTSLRGEIDKLQKSAAGTSGNAETKTKLDAIVDSLEKLKTDQLSKLESQFNANKEYVNLSPTVPVFKGRHDEDVEDWLFIIERNMLQLRMHEAAKVNAVANFVKNHAYHVYKKYVSNGGSIWSEFKHVMRYNFGSDNKKLELRDQLRYLKQTKSVSDYNDQFSEITAAIGDMTELEMVSAYLFGLDPRISSLVRNKGGKTIADVMRDARMLDVNGYKQDANPVGVSYIKQINGPGRGGRGYTGKPRFPFRCYKCNNVGHKSANCTKKFNREQKTRI
jgi:hypothetical protein